jgi:hypothetical protein
MMPVTRRKKAQDRSGRFSPQPQAKVQFGNFRAPPPRRQGEKGALGPESGSVVEEKRKKMGRRE